MTQNFKTRLDPRDAYPALSDLMGDNGYYFYEDWDADFESIEEIIKTFCEIESPAQKRTTIEEIQRFLEDYDQEDEEAMEDEMDDALCFMGNSYYYYNGGYTSVSWLKHLQAEIQKSLEK